ncbi:ATP-dependent helicase/nuclease subunit B [Desulfovibrionales bacterium]
MRPFLLVPWENNFLAWLSKYLRDAQGAALHERLVVFPHRRPRRYLLKYLAEDPALPKPLLPPRILTMDEWMAELAMITDHGLRRLISPLDRVSLLTEVLLGLDTGRDKETASAGSKLNQLAKDLQNFFPWGMRLADLSEELFRHGRTGCDLAYTEEAIVPPATAILQQLGVIQHRYLALLDSRGLTTPGLSHSRIAEAIENLVDQIGSVYPLDNAGQPRILVCGFVTLTGTENVFLHRLWTAGLIDIVINGDTDLAKGRGHQACSGLTAWAARWGANFKPVLNASPDNINIPLTDKVRFWEGYDLHSQLKVLEEELTDPERRPTTAVILPNTGLLLPVLHHLSNKDVNIDVSYPMVRTVLFRLLDTIFRLQENRREGRYYKRDVLALARHPVLRMLGVATQDHGKHPLFHPLLYSLEAWVRRDGNRFVDIRNWRPKNGDYDLYIPKGTTKLLHQVLTTCFNDFSRLHTLRDLIESVDRLLDLLTDPTLVSTVWARFFIEAEALYQLRTTVLPDIAASTFCHTSLAPATLFSILRRLLKAEQIPLEAESLDGTQILGLLESRLQAFGRVIILDATEDRLLETLGPDPLLPDSLRSILGLPDNRKREQVAAYNFYRFIAMAGEVILCWQAGAQSSPILDVKTVRSRFVEQLLWDVERRRGSPLHPGEPPYGVIRLPLRSIPTSGWSIPKTPAVRTRLEAQLEQLPLSVSFFDLYLRCPTAFFFRYLSGLTPTSTSLKAENTPALGELIHDLLAQWIRPWCGQQISARDMDSQGLADAFSRQLRESAFFANMPWDQQLMLEITGRERLHRFAAATPDTKPLCVELNLEATCRLADRQLRLIGRLDRLDQRKEGLIILDYKTGSVAVPRWEFFTDQTFWKTTAAMADPDGLDPTAILELYAQAEQLLGSLQLSFYLMLYSLTALALADSAGLPVGAVNTGQIPNVMRDGQPIDAAWVELADRGQERRLLGDPPPPGLNAATVAERLPIFLELLLRHLLGPEDFFPRPGRLCINCAFRNGCIAAASC